jgi:guanylate kinase
MVWLTTTTALCVCAPLCVVFSCFLQGTLIEKLSAAFPDTFGFSVSHTTRAPRAGEEDGVHYHFTTREAMQADIDEGKFIEHADVHGKLYGTSCKAVEDVAAQARICILDIDVQGVRSVKSSTLDPVYVFVEPPSMAVLEKRLRSRGTETAEQVARRIANAAGEMEFGQKPGNFDINLVNDDLETAFKTLVSKLAADYPALKA